MPARRAAIRAVPAEPDALADLTPPAKAISADGDLWCWQLNGISALGVSVEPAPPFGEQRAGATGTYLLRNAPDGATSLAIDITITAELPLPQAARRAVEKVMAATMARTGDRLARNLSVRLGLDPKFVATS